MQTKTTMKEVEEKSAREKNGWVMLFVVLVLIAASVALIATGAAKGGLNPSYAALAPFVGSCIRKSAKPDPTSVKLAPISAA